MVTVLRFNNAGVDGPRRGGHLYVYKFICGESKMDKLWIDDATFLVQCQTSPYVQELVVPWEIDETTKQYVVVDADRQLLHTFRPFKDCSSEYTIIAKSRSLGYIKIGVNKSSSDISWMHDEKRIMSTKRTGWNNRRLCVDFHTGDPVYLTKIYDTATLSYYSAMCNVIDESLNITCLDLPGDGCDAFVVNHNIGYVFMTYGIINVYDGRAGGCRSATITIGDIPSRNIDYNMALIDSNNIAICHVNGFLGETTADVDVLDIRSGRMVNNFTPIRHERITTGITRPLVIY